MRWASIRACRKPCRKALAGKYPVNVTELVVYPTNFACPSAVFNDPADGEHYGIADVMSPWSGAVAEDAVALVDVERNSKTCNGQDLQRIQQDINRQIRIIFKSCKSC